jgi:hypothetical protein
MKTKENILTTIKDIIRKERKIVISIAFTFTFFLFSIVQADASLIYSNNFDGQNVDLSAWTSSGIEKIHTEKVPNTELKDWGTFLGQFGNDTVTLSLTGISDGWVTVSFDTYFIRSWDGSADATDNGSDYFSVSVSNSSLLHETFSNGNAAGQSYIGNGIRAEAYSTGSNNSMEGSTLQYALGYTFYNGNTGKTEAMDSVYNFTFSFYNTSDYLNFIFAGSGLQSSLVTLETGDTYHDESWGLDNIKVDVTPVPEPSTLLLFASGAFGLIPFRIRWKKFRKN